MMNTQLLLEEGQKSLVDERNPSGHKCQYTHWAVMLYPQECIEHENLIQWIESHPTYKSVRIVHDRDVDENGELKKPHVHMLIVTPSKTTVKGFLSFFGAWVDYVEPVRDTSSYILYMLHDTPNSIGKFHYDPSLLIGDAKLIKKATGSEAIIQKNNFV